MPSKFQKGDVVRVYTKSLKKVENKFGKKKFIEPFIVNPKNSDFIFPHYRVMIIEKKSKIQEANITFKRRGDAVKSNMKLKDKKYYMLADEKCVRFLNPYGDAVLTKASKEERERFMERYIANRVAKDL